MTVKFKSTQQDKGTRQTVLRFAITILISGMIVSLAACGKKPAHLDLPPGVVTDEGARVYPEAEK